MRLSAIALAALLAGCASGPGNFSYTVPDQPEGASGYTEKPGWATQKFAVAAANPLATDAGYQVLKAGGSAVDAAIAVQMVLALVEPQSSGIGGGAFLMHFDGKDVEAYRRARDRTGCGRREAVPGRRRQAAAVLRGRRRWPLGRRARHGAHAGTGAPATRQIALGHACSSRRSRWPTAASRSAPGSTACWPAKNTCATTRSPPPTSTAPTAARAPWAKHCATRNWPRCCARSPATDPRRCSKAMSPRPSSTRCRATRPIRAS